MCCFSLSPQLAWTLHTLAQFINVLFNCQYWFCGGRDKTVMVQPRWTCVGKTACMEDKMKYLYHNLSLMLFVSVVQQEFFSLAWSTVLMSRGGGASAQHCSILAAGGKKGLVKLIHPRNNMAYGEFRASRKALSVLRFNHRQGNFLFSESRLLRIEWQLAVWVLFGCQSPISEVQKLTG